MPDDDLLARIAETREALGRLERQLIETPRMAPAAAEHLERAVMLLHEASVAVLAGSGSVADPNAVRFEVRGMRRQLARVRALLSAAAEFHAGWAELVATIMQGYRRTGQVIELRVPGRLLAEG